MLFCIALLTAVLSLLQHVSASIAPDIMTIQEGYNLVAKVPCSGCPFLYQDTSKGLNEPWTERKDNNALLLNISLPYDSAYLTINNALISPIQRTLPQIYANQVLLDIPVADLSSVISSDQLEGSHSAGGFFGLSYRHSLRFLKDTPAFLFQFDILEIWSDLPETPILHKVNSADQKMLEVILIEKPLISALSSSGFEILKAELVPRSRHPVAPTSPQQTMYFLDWDSNGRKGTAAHALTAFGFWFLDFLDQGLWAMFTFIAGVIALFIVACVFCTFGWGFWRGDYEKAQHGKKRRKTDVEAAARMPFKSAEQLGFSRGRVIGIGKGD